MTPTYHLTRVSGNVKTGPIPVSTSSKATCPTGCALKGNGCYAESGPLALHWAAVSDGRRGGTLEELCAQVRKFPKDQLWRWAQAGDLPGDGHRIDRAALGLLIEANKGRRGFGYTHYDAFDDHNAEAIAAANDAGFVINLSADSLEDADALAALDIAPVACVLPIGTTESLRTPGGNHVSVCPATVRDDVTCASCGICAVPGHKAVIGFPAHGSRAKVAQTVFFQRRLEFA
jgi:hypothetical protein